MTREATAEKKSNRATPDHTSSTSYSDGVDSEETEVSDAATDSCSDVDLNELDKNNNRSPAPHQRFPVRPNACAFQYSNEAYSETAMASNDPRHANDDNTQEAEGRLEEESFVPENGEEIALGNYLENDVFHDARDDGIVAESPEGVALRSRHTNANENNNSNRKKFRGISPTNRSASYDMQNNNIRNFRHKMRSVQLSSVRASKGRYQGSEIKPYKGRMISKNGASNVRLKKLGKLDWVFRYSKDIYTTLIDLGWTWVILLTAIVYVGHWIIFGLIYWIFAIVNDDYTKIFGIAVSSETEGLNLSTSTATAQPHSIEIFQEEPCVSGVYDFASAFLFSMESETTIGYGYRNMGTTCKGAIVCLVLQCVISAIFDTWVIGMCFSRMARPDARCNTILYAKNAVICTRDGKKCLIVRVANLRKSLLLGVSCRARVITLRAPQWNEEKEGHQFMLEQKELEFENANCTMLTAPVEYRHVIDKNSPLYSIPAKCFLCDKQNWFEIVIILTGMVEATGMTTHAQTSYLSSEIKYRHRYAPVLSVSHTKERYVVDFSKFHDTAQEPRSVARLAMRKRSSLLYGRFEALLEESEEDDVFDRTSNNDQKSECEFCSNNGTPCQCQSNRKRQEPQDINRNSLSSSV